MPKIYPNRIRDYDQAARLSMQALADRAGTSAPQINKLEKGERKLTVDWMVRLRRALNVDPKDLLVLEPMDGPSPDADGTSPRRLYQLPSSLNATAVELGRPDLPILGRAQGGPNAVLMIP